MVGRSKVSLEPFLKWAGGKRWLLQRDEPLAPVSYKTYLEPFLGGASMFLSMSASPFVISDLNTDLINCYRAIRDDHKKVEKYLVDHQAKHSDDYYYVVRASKSSSRFVEAARLIYLNRTCFNGLYRVNLKGEFNVPRGTKDKVLMQADDFAGIADRLKNGDIISQDFEKTISLAGNGDFVFVDPPYTVNHNRNGFLKYNEKIFSWADQTRLKNCIVQAVEKGAMVTMTNADHESIVNLYSEIGEITKISRNSVIGGKSSSRGMASELIIRIGWAVN